MEQPYHSMELDNDVQGLWFSIPGEDIMVKELVALEN
jgi:hypothetical protein